MKPHWQKPVRFFYAISTYKIQSKKIFIFKDTFAFIMLNFVLKKIMD
jgi:hypothetical protein